MIWPISIPNKTQVRASPNSENLGLQDYPTKTGSKNNMLYLPSRAAAHIKRIAQVVSQAELATPTETFRDRQASIYYPVDFNALWFRNETMYLKSQKYMKNGQRLIYLLHKFMQVTLPTLRTGTTKLPSEKRVMKICSIFNISSVHCSKFY